MICVLDVNDYCARHKAVHYGRLKELALLNDEQGEAYRLLWDQYTGGALTATSFPPGATTQKALRKVRESKPCNCGAKKNIT